MTNLKKSAEGSSALSKRRKGNETDRKLHKKQIKVYHLQRITDPKDYISILKTLQT